MCIICDLWSEGKMTKKEVDNAVVELLEVKGKNGVDMIHAQEVINMVDDHE